MVGSKETKGTKTFKNKLKTKSSVSRRRKIVQMMKRNQSLFSKLKSIYRGSHHDGFRDEVHDVNSETRVLMNWMAR